MKMTAFWDRAPCSTTEVDLRFRGAYCLIIALMMESVRTSETLMYFKKTTWLSIPEGCHLQLKLFSDQDILFLISFHVITFIRTQ
jgi:hypothetical protein